MEDKRLFNRLFREGEDQAVFRRRDNGQGVGSIIDLSAGGMRVALRDEVNVGEELYGHFQVLDMPYYVRGKVNRVAAQGNDWEVAIAFEKVSSIPIEV
jgi:hypothetical protein